MNTNNVVSAPGAADLTGKEYRVVKMTSTGINLCASGNIAGTLLRAQPHQEDGVYAGKAVAVHLAYASINNAMIGFSSAAVAAGAGLILDTASGNDGKLVPSESSPVAIAWEAFTAADGAIVRVQFI